MFMLIHGLLGIANNLGLSSGLHWDVHLNSIVRQALVLMMG